MGLTVKVSFRPSSATEGAGIVREDRARGDIGTTRRPRHSTLHTRMSPVQNLYKPEIQPLHLHSRKRRAKA